MNSIKDLEKAIFVLTQLQSVQGELLKSQYRKTIDSLKPANIIKSSLNNMVHSPDMLKNIFSISMGIFSGYLGNKIFVGTSKSIPRRIIGNLIQIGITTAVSANADTVKAFGSRIIGLIFRKKAQQEQ